MQEGPAGVVYGQRLSFVTGKEGDKLGWTNRQLSDWDQPEKSVFWLFFTVFRFGGFGMLKFLNS